VRGYTRKDPAQLAYDANKKRLRAEVSVITDAVLNEVLSEMTKQFNDALNRGEILTIGGTRDEVLGYVGRATKRLAR
jgi:hypothetical protein